MESEPLELKHSQNVGDGTFQTYGHNEEMWGERSFQEICIYRLLENMLSFKVGSKICFVYLLTSYLLKSIHVKNFI